MRKRSHATLQSVFGSSVAAPVDRKSSRRLSLSASVPFALASADVLLLAPRLLLVLAADLEGTEAGISSPIEAAAAAAASKSLRVYVSVGKNKKKKMVD